MVSNLDTGVKARYHKLKYWQEQGGVMLMGFEMFRNLAVGSRLKQKSHQVGFKQFLLDPGIGNEVCHQNYYWTVHFVCLDMCLHLNLTFCTLT